MLKKRIIGIMLIEQSKKKSTTAYLLDELKTHGHNANEMVFDDTTLTLGATNVQE